MTPIGRLRTLALVNVALVAAACDPPTRASSLSLTPAQYEILFRGDRVVSVFSSQGCTTIPGPGFVNAYVLAHLDLTVVDGVWRGRPQSDADGALFAAVPVAKALKQRIRSERQLTASIGIGSNKFLAKLGSDFQKPDGLTLIPERDKAAFLRPLPVRSIHGVGPVTARALDENHIVTIGDLQDTSAHLGSIIGSWADTLKARAFGDDDRPLDLSDERKSISSETTSRGTGAPTDISWGSTTPTNRHSAVCSRFFRRLSMTSSSPRLRSQTTPGSSRKASTLTKYSPVQSPVAHSLGLRPVRRATWQAWESSLTSFWREATRSSTSGMAPSCSPGMFRMIGRFPLG